MLDSLVKIQKAVKGLNFKNERDRKKFSDAVVVMGQASVSLGNFLLCVDPEVGLTPKMRKAFDAITKQQELRDQEILDILES